MSMFTILSFIVYGYFMYKLGKVSQQTAIGDATIQNLKDRAKFPAVVAEKIDGYYYLYEKDTANFLCQAPTLEEIPLQLYENKKISLAVLMCPQETGSQLFWCLNGKLMAAS